MISIIAKSIYGDVYPDYCELKAFHKEIVLHAKIEEAVHNGMQLHDIAKMGQENPTKLMGELDICTGCAYLRNTDCKGAEYKQ